MLVWTPLDLTWQLNNSMNRLLLQLWPCAVLVFFLSLRRPEEARKPELAGVPSKRKPRDKEKGAKAKRKK